jgi:beta-galactosidase
VVKDSKGFRLQVDGRDFMVIGMNWDYFPIGTNYNYSLWKQPEDVIEAALAREMPLLKAMGVNAIRVYSGIPARWVRHIYERYGIYSVVNHTVGRYGYNLDGAWIPAEQIDYSNPRFRAAVTADVLAMVDELKNTPGVLMWMLGNENNYGLSWRSTEIENLPVGEQDTGRARFLYSLFGEVIRAIKARDPDHLVSIANGDVQYADLIAQECKGLDVFGANSYRGISFTDLFQVVNDKLGLPVVLTEFGADAWNAREMREDPLDQAIYDLGNWKEIYEESAGKGRVGNAVGGFTFQWSDGWWKYKQEANLDVHDTNASWSNGGYLYDYVKGENNMNEEWFGICAKGPPDARGLFDEYPRAAYYALREAFRLRPYDAKTDLAAIQAHFSAIEPALLAVTSRANQASLSSAILERVRLSNLRLQLSTFSTGGTRISTPPSSRPQNSAPSYLGFGSMESFFADVQVQPVPQLVATVSVNVLGGVARNPIDEIFYESRGRPKQVVAADGTTLVLNDLERVQVYSASLTWDEPWFNLEAFYRTGHVSWAHEGDFFFLYPEAFYGDNMAWGQRQIDIYDAIAPSGFVLAGKKAAEGLKIAYGPQLWWGANPALMLKYTRAFGPIELTLVDEEQVGLNPGATASSVVPEQQQRRTALSLKAQWGIARLQIGGIQSGAPTAFAPNTTGKLGQTYQVAGQASSDRISVGNTFGGKAKVSVESGPWHWYGQGAYMGLVADAGYDPTVTYTGWTLKDSGSGNQANALTGLAVNVGQFQIGPNFLWQKPLVGPGPSNAGFPARNVLDDPFAVRGNRETIAGELLIAYDPTPATWMWAWDNLAREDAPFAASLDFTYRHQPTTTDASTFVSAAGDRFPFAFGSPAANVWELKARIVSAPLAGLRLAGQLYGGRAQAVGPSSRLVDRYGGDARITWNSLAFQAFLKFNDWGAYDYYRDFNQTYPLQVMGDLSYTLGLPAWLASSQTRIGLRGTFRTLNGYSNRFVPDPANPGEWGNEWEIRTYLNVSL